MLVLVVEATMSVCPFIIYIVLFASPARIFLLTFTSLIVIRILMCIFYHITSNRRLLYIVSIRCVEIAGSAA